MNGYISKNVLTGNLARLAQNVQNAYGSELNVAALSEALTKFQADMVAAANRTPLETLVEALADTKPNQKIQLIKRVRELGGMGLKEAKDLVEDFLPAALVVQINEKYKELAVANAQVGWNQTKLPDQTLLNPPTTSEERQDDKETDEPW